MRIKNTVAAILISSVVSLFAQNAPSTAPTASVPGGMPTMPMRRAGAGRAPKRAAFPTAEAMASQQMKELEETVSQMQAMLKQMQAKAASSKSRDTQDNLRMWEVLVGHLDHTLAQARLLAAERADMTARRQALYQQAQAKADAEAARARAEMAAAAAGPNATSAPASSVIAPAPAPQASVIGESATKQ
jgi:multidrug resistance efflux pump